MMRLLDAVSWTGIEIKIRAEKGKMGVAGRDMGLLDLGRGF